MLKNLLLFGMMMLALALTACAGVAGYTQPAGLFPYGYIYTESTSGSVVLENGVTPMKEGKACGNWILFIGTGDTSVESAMHNGGIKKLVFVKQSIKSVLGPIYGEVCTIARGN
jgi:hypothetical protein